MVHRLDRSQPIFELSLRVPLRVVKSPYHITLAARQETEHLFLDIETSFGLTIGETTRSLEPQTSEAAEVLQSVVERSRLHTFRAYESGALEIELEDALIEVPPDPNFEAWNLHAQGLHLVALPGGGIA